MLAFAAGFLLDMLIGDPHRVPHPVRWMGSLIAFLDGRLLRLDKSEDINAGGSEAGSDFEPERSPEPQRDSERERRRGLLLVIIVLCATLAVSLAVMIPAYHISDAAGIVIEAILTCYCLAMTSLRRESMKVYDELVRGDLEGARHAVSMIVGRDTAVLDETGVTKAAVETVAENLSDGVIAPMLYMAIGGPVLGLTYKAINTMDSMIGYRNDRYRWFGTAAARLDDFAGYIPSRISAFLLIAASALGDRDYDAGRAFRIWRRDRYNHKSPNAAQTESACAGSLGLMLAGDAQYFGRIVRKPTIGDDTRPIEYEDIKRANRLMIISSVMAELVCLAIMQCIAA